MKIFSIYFQQKTETFFLFPYSPVSGRLRGESPEDCRAYNFKIFGTGADDYRLVLLALKKILQADLVAGIPASKKEKKNFISRICPDAIFKRTISRGTRHNDQAGIDLVKEKQSVVIADSLAGKKILLCDDITTTGATMNLYRKWLLEAGAKVFCFSVGHAQIDSLKGICKFAVCIVDQFRDDDQLDRQLQSLLL